MERREAIRKRLDEFAAVAPTEYFYELAYCLLTPQSSARNADAVVAALRAARFQEEPFDPEPMLRSRDQYIRFHRTKSRHLLLAREQFAATAEILRSGLNAADLREWLVKQVKGLGMKEASHFLRNIGRNEGLTILDRHILRNLVRHGVIRRLPKTLSRKEYLRIERGFIRFASEIGIPVDELDLLFWSMETGEVRK